MLAQTVGSFSCHDKFLLRHVDVLAAVANGSHIACTLVFITLISCSVCFYRIIPLRVVSVVVVGVDVVAVTSPMCLDIERKR